MAAFITNKNKVFVAESFINEFDVITSKNVPQDINIAGTFVGVDTDFMTELYEYYFGRAPDAPGLAYWLSVLSSGAASRRQIEIETFLQGEGNVINSLYFTSGRPNKWTSEYIPDLNIASVFSSASNTEFVSNLFLNYYLRDADSGELQYWASAIDNGTLTRRNVELNYFVPGEDRNVDIVNLGTKEYLYWDEIISLKRVNTNDIKLVVPKHSWSSGTTYLQYDDTIPKLMGNAFYVLNSEYNVYKCISNSTVSSTIEPLGTSATTFKTADGYKWKYMYTIDAGDQAKFITNAYMPVDFESTVVNSAQDGAIENIVVINSGSNYINTADVVVTITGDGDGTARANANVVSNSIVGFNIITPGNNYRIANVTIVGLNAGSGAKGRAVIGPYGGHGYDPKNELGAYYAMVYTNLAYSETNFPIRSYRRIGLLKNPIIRNTDSVATVATINGNYSINLLSNSNTFFVADEYITGNISGANAFVVSVSSDNKYIRYIQSKDSTNNFTSFLPGERIRGSHSSAIGVVSTINSPDVYHDSGQFLFVDNRAVINKDPAQTETFNIVFKF